MANSFIQDYIDILEFPTEMYKTSFDDIDSSSLYKIVHKFSKSVDDENIIVSLSGGVDSMVLISLLKFCEPTKQIVAIHINYKNRDETDKEEEFLETWCLDNNIIMITHVMDIQRSTTNREFYEKETKQQRFDFYKRVMNIYSSNGIYLAHHKGDEQENIFSNIINGKNILSISAMSTIAMINDVNIYRPFITIVKSDIYEIAHKYNIPYFKDTTPDWSNRGKLRRQIFPLLQSVYGKKYLHNFTSIGKESSEWNNFIIEFIVDPFIKNNVVKTEVTIEIDIDSSIKKYPECFWDVVFKKMSIVVSKKAIGTFVYKLKTNFSGSIPLNKYILCKIVPIKITIIKIE